MEIAHSLASAEHTMLLVYLDARREHALGILGGLVDAGSPRRHLAPGRPQL